MNDQEEAPGHPGWNWQQLTKEEKYVLNEAYMSHRLVDAMNGWGAESGWKEKGKYAPALAAAAKHLVELDLIDVWEEPIGIGEARLLFHDEATTMVGDPSNWWGYDWDEASPSEGTRGRILTFSLGATDKARKLV